MRQVHYSVATSLDGYITGPNGEIDWILMDPEIDFAALMGRFDTVLLGRKSWEASRAMGGAGMPGMKAHVFSTTLKPADAPGVAVSAEPEKAVSELKRSAGKDIWLFGGGSLFRSLLALGLVDVVSVAVIPVLVGGGVPLLPSPATQRRLKLTDHRVYRTSGTVWLEYAVQ